MTANLPFDYAIIRFACLQPKGQGQNPRLVFASVEMLPSGRAIPDATPLDEKCYPPSLSTKMGRLFFRRVGLPAADALNWYRNLDVLPDQEGTHAKKPLEHVSLVDEPTWGADLWSALAVPLPPPLLPGPMDEDRIDPYAGANREAVRVHRRLTTGDTAVDALHDLPEEKKKEAFRWLRLRTWVDFDLYPELMCSAALIVPDPDVRTVRSRLDRNETGQETVFFEFEWRGQPGVGLRLTAQEERYGSLVWQETFDVPADGVVRAPRPQPVEKIGWSLVHPVRGVIASKPMTGYLRAITSNINLQGRETRLISKDGRGKNSQQSTRSVREVSSEKLTTGTPFLPPGSLAKGRERRRIARNSETEFWFDNPTVARDKLWDLISHAQSDVMLVDPYADGRDLLDYGMASTGARVRLLTAGKATVDRELFDISDGLRDMSKASKRAEARRMNVLIHDRFVTIDGSVWSLGASLNGLGGDATMLIRLRNPQPVLERLEHVWASATIIEAS
ncbi:VPA1262 family N-terminal domain-containing protein [Xanthobacter sp. TB0139]|uniref:VPA1262 family N-terminal domain-containing protein n=1 Tax=Xanthobacter sp. TB0139 TaxID=3459178 RepID=UPI00403967D8